MEADSPWISDRRQAELDRAERIALFDTFVDFVLDGEVEFDIGLSAYRETLEQCGLDFPARIPGQLSLEAGPPEAR